MFPSSIRLKIEKQICKSVVERPRAWLMCSVRAWNNNAYIYIYIKNAGRFMGCALPVIHMQWLSTTTPTAAFFVGRYMCGYAVPSIFRLLQISTSTNTDTHCHRVSSDKPRLYSNTVECHFCSVRFHLNLRQKNIALDPRWCILAPKHMFKFM